MSFTLTNSPLPGPVLAIDLGEKRIGLAVSDSGRMIARSYGVIERKSRREDFARFQAIISEQKVTLVVMGLPLHLDGSDSATTAWVRVFCRLHADLGPVTLWDKRYSSQAATASLTERGVRAKKQKGRVDAVAATLVLQSYLDTQTGPYTAQ